MGRKAIQIKKIEKQKSRDVTFSKRRKGLFNKAKELSILCGAKTAVIVISRAGKAFTFGDPYVEELVNHYRHGTRPPNSSSTPASVPTTNHQAPLNSNNNPPPVADCTTTTNQEQQLLWWEMMNFDEIPSDEFYSKAELLHYQDLLTQEKKVNDFLVQKTENMARMNQTSSQPSNENSSAASSHIDQILISCGEGSNSDVVVDADLNPHECEDSNDMVENDGLTWGEFDDIMALLDEIPGEKRESPDNNNDVVVEDIAMF